MDNEHRFCLQQRKFGLAVLLRAWGARWTSVDRRRLIARCTDGIDQRSLLCTSGRTELAAVQGVSRKTAYDLIPAGTHLGG